jgi:DNA repair protein RAD57
MSDLSNLLELVLMNLSGAGKTQFLLTLLLSAQLPAPDGLGAPVLYMSTESALPTQRIAQLLRTHPRLVRVPGSSKPSLDKVISITVPDLESQDHILHYQVPVAIRRHGIRLIIIDSIAANYRAEFEGANGQATGAGSGGANMAQRSAKLVELGRFLRDLARQHNLAVVVSNQVADRFAGNIPVAHHQAQSRMQSSPLERRSGPGIPPSSINLPYGDDDVLAPTPTPRSHGGTIDPMSLDHQQRFFTGWGDDPHPTASTSKSMKTPSLGLIWSSQIACRIALIKKPVYGQSWVEGGVRGEGHEDGEGGELVLKRWRRWVKVVFASHAPASGRGTYGAVEFEIKGEGLRALSKDPLGEKEDVKGDEA